MLPESGRPRSSSATDWPMLPEEAAELSSGPLVQVEPNVNWPDRGSGRVVERPLGPGGAKRELAGLRVAGEPIGLLVDAVSKAGADGVRDRRFGQGGWA